MHFVIIWGGSSGPIMRRLSNPRIGYIASSTNVIEHCWNGIPHKPLLCVGVHKLAVQEMEVIHMTVPVQVLYICIEKIFSSGIQYPSLQSEIY